MGIALSFSRGGALALATADRDAESHLLALAAGRRQVFVRSGRRGTADAGAAFDLRLRPRERAARRFCQRFDRAARPRCRATKSLAGQRPSNRAWWVGRFRCGQPSRRSVRSICPSRREKEFTHAENGYLQITTENGWLGAVLLAAGIGLVGGLVHRLPALAGSTRGAALLWRGGGRTRRKPGPFARRFRLVHPGLHVADAGAGRMRVAALTNLAAQGRRKHGPRFAGARPRWFEGHRRGDVAGRLDHLRIRRARRGGRALEPLSPRPGRRRSNSWRAAGHVRRGGIDRIGAGHARAAGRSMQQHLERYAPLGPVVRPGPPQAGGSLRAANSRVRNRTRRTRWVCSRFATPPNRRRLRRPEDLQDWFRTGRRPQRQVARRWPAAMPARQSRSIRWQARVMFYWPISGSSTGIKSAATDAYMAQRSWSARIDGDVLFEVGRQLYAHGHYEEGMLQWAQCFANPGPHQLKIINLLAGRMPARDFLEAMQPDWRTFREVWARYRQHGRPTGLDQYGGVRSPGDAARLERQRWRATGVSCGSGCSSICDDLEQRDQSLACLEKAYQCDQHVFGVRQKLGFALKDAGRYSEAEPHMRWCLARRPENKGSAALLEISKQRLAQREPTSAPDEAGARSGDDERSAANVPRYSSPHLIGMTKHDLQVNARALNGCSPRSSSCRCSRRHTRRLPAALCRRAERPVLCRLALHAARRAGAEMADLFAISHLPGVDAIRHVSRPDRAGQGGHGEHRRSDAHRCLVFTSICRFPAASS